MIQLFDICRNQDIDDSLLINTQEIFPIWEEACGPATKSLAGIIQPNSMKINPYGRRIKGTLQCISLANALSSSVIVRWDYTLCTPRKENCIIDKISFQPKSKHHAMAVQVLYMLFIVLLGIGIFISRGSKTIGN